MSDKGKCVKRASMAIVSTATTVKPNTAPNESEDAKNKVKKAKLFKATIAVCSVYAFIALAVLLMCIFTDSGKALLVEQAGAFTITLVTGMLLVIVFLAIAVFKYEPAAEDRLRTDPYACPDYFELVRTTDAELEKLPAAHRQHMQYRCMPLKRSSVNPSGMFDTTGVPSHTAQPTGFTSASGTLKDVVKAVNEGIATADAALKMSCTNIYPAYLDAADYKANPDFPTKFRCAYVDATTGCKGLSWSSVCPTST